MDLHDVFEKAFLQEQTKLNYIEDGVKTTIQGSGDSVIITKETDVSQFLKQADIERRNFQMSKNTQDHFTKIASIPMVVYDAIMQEADRQKIFNHRDRNDFLVNSIRDNFKGFLTIPENYIRKT